MQEDGYVVFSSESSSVLELHGWLVPSEILSDLNDFFGLLAATIEANTDYFAFDASKVSKISPVLPYEMPSGTVFFDYPGLYHTTAKKFYLDRWEFLLLSLPELAFPGDRPFAAKIKWFYKDTSPVFPSAYLYPNNRCDYPGEDGTIIKASSYGGGSAVDISLLRWITDVNPYPQGEYKYVIDGMAMEFHEMGGSPDWSDYESVASPTWFYHVLATSTPPAQPSYTGGNVWNISEEFSDQIEIYSSEYLYTLDLEGTNMQPWRSQVALADPSPITDTPLLLLPFASLASPKEASLRKAVGSLIPGVIGAADGSVFQINGHDFTIGGEDFVG